MSTSPSPQPSRTFTHRAATYSWQFPFILFALFAVGGQIGARVIIDLIALLFIIAGLVFGVIALLGIRRHGSKNILVPAVAGIIANGVLLFIFITNFLAARASALSQ